MELLNFRGLLGFLICIASSGHVLECAHGPNGHELSGNVKSLDVYGDSGMIHLLLATNTGDQKNASLFYTSSSDIGSSWDSYTPIDTSCAPAFARGRGSDFQIAASGKRILVVWMQHGTGFMGRGPLSSAFSSDGGKTWRNVGNPADDGSDGDHAFIDLTADDRGNFHAVWLDKRSGTDKGLYSAFFESNSQKWNKNSTLDSKVCDCCWNVVKSSRTGRLHALYRDKVPRDMGLAISHDYGKSWRKAGPVGDFQWMFEACVHVGGGLAIEEKEGKDHLHAVVWTGNEFDPGLYYLSQKNHEGSWHEPLRLGGLECSLPDIGVSDCGELAIAWIERASDRNTLTFLKHSNGKKMDPKKAIRLKTNVESPTHPKILNVGNSFVLFWSGQKDGREVWRYVRL